MNAFEIARLFLEAALGAAIGSFAATAAMRSARSAPWISGRSKCDGCEKPLGYAETTPILSYLWRRGRCGLCGGAIHPLHPIGEGLGALIALLFVGAAPSMRGALEALTAYVILYASVFDVLTLRIPDLSNLCIFLLCGVAAVADHRFAQNLAGAAALFVLGWVGKRVFAQVRGREGLGGGDVKLMAALSLGLGLYPFSWALAAAAGLALLWIGFAAVSKQDRPARVPFGPFLGLGWGVAAFGTHLI